MRFQIVDAFTDDLFGGNPAGVVIVPELSDFPDEEIMIKTAAELRYSETVFLKPLSGDKFRARFFTPASEVDLCGHATIGSAYSLMDMGMVSEGSTIVYETGAGNIRVSINKGSIFMDMAEPRLLDEISEFAAVKELFDVMGLLYRDDDFSIKGISTKLLPRKVTTGLVDIIMPVRDADELDCISPDFDALAGLSKRYEAVGVHAFTISADDGTLHARNFAPLYGIDEEAATGTANAALTYYLYNVGLIKKNAVNEIIQGAKMGRPSKVSTLITAKNGKPLVRAGGSAVVIAEGEIFI